MSSISGELGRAGTRTGTGVASRTSCCATRPSDDYKAAKTDQQGESNKTDSDFK